MQGEYGIILYHVVLHPLYGPGDGGRARTEKDTRVRGWLILERVAEKQKILIVDDSEMNRSILSDMLGDEYDILEAENGRQGVEVLQKHAAEISLVLLDIVMPEMDGFGVLTMMNKYHWIE